MADYDLGQQVTIYRTFLEEDAPVDPTSVEVSVETPSGEIETFVSGVDAELTNPSVGYYELAYLPAEPGTYNYRWDSTYPSAGGEGSFTVAYSALGAPIPTTGPCETWVSADDVAEHMGTRFTGGTDTTVLERWAEIASEVFFVISGSVWSGECGPRVERPCDDGCSCWGRALARYGNAWTWDPAGGRWACREHTCGCAPLSEIELDPDARRIIEVKIDGDVVPADEYRLDPGGLLVRTRDSAEPDERRRWPGCQILDLPDTEEGTFSVEYTYGLDPPDSGREAAKALAAELYLAHTNNGRCKLPAGTREVVRGGARIEIGALVAESLKRGATGILAIDTFVAAFVRLDKAGNPVQESTVWSPDLDPPSRRVF